MEFMYHNKHIFQIPMMIQNYLVAGGAVSFSEYTDNTEVFSGGKWTSVEPLDMALSGLQGVTVNNNVYMIGDENYAKTFNSVCFYFFPESSD